MHQYEKIKGYTALVCEQIRWKKAHEYISRELEDHIIDHADSLVENGMDEDNATNMAIMEMGDPVIVGTQLDHAYKPKAEWSVIALTALSLFIGIMISFILPSGTDTAHSSIGQSLMISAIGCICMIITYSIDFTVIGKFSMHLFVILLIASVFMFQLIPNLFNSKFLYIYGRVVGIKYLLMIFPTVFAGIIYGLRSKGYAGIFICGALILAPSYIGIISSNTSSVFFHAATCVILLIYAVLKGWFNVKKLKGLCLACIPAAAALSVILYEVILKNDYLISRIKSIYKIFINPAADPYGSGYINTIIRNTINEARLFGRGGYLYAKDLSLPNSNTDYLLTYLIDRFGFISLFIIMTVLSILILRLIFLSKNQKNILGKLISASIIITFSIQIAAYLMNNFGFQLFSALPLPFIAYGGVATIINMSQIGIVLSVFKSGDITRDGCVSGFGHNNKSPRTNEY